MGILGNQLHIEGENNELFIYFHLHDFKLFRALEVLEEYISAFKSRDFEKINVSFLNTGVPGEHLGNFRRTKNEAIGKVLKGVKCIDACFHSKDNLKVFSLPKLFN